MKQWVKGHGKILLICVAAFAALLAVVSARQKEKFKENSIGNTMGNPERSEEAFVDTFYFDQLTEKEQSAYETLKAALENMQGGEIIFPEPLNGLEFTRAYNALEYGAGDYFYGMVGIPMTEDNQNLAYDNENFQNMEESLIHKCLLFLYCAEGIDMNGEMDDDGYVTNLEEHKGPLAENNEERLAEVRDIQERTEEVLNQVIADMPEEYGAKEAMNYFLSWMDENMTLQTASEQSSGISLMSDFFSKLNFKNHLSCAADQVGFASGYVRMFSELCNRVGIKSHVVMGTWSTGLFSTSEQSYMLACVEIDGEPIYVDVSGTYSEQLLEQRYLTEEGAMNWLTFVDYFTYGDE